MSSQTTSWLILLHQIPPAPPYLRAKILRRLKQIGALSLKKSAYLLPEAEDTFEDFQWLLEEMRSEGAEGWIFRVQAVAGVSDDSIRDGFRKMRADDYKELLAEAQAIEKLIGTAGDEGEASPDVSLRKLKKRLGQVASIDFFDAPGKGEVTTLMTAIENKLRQERLIVTAEAPKPAVTEVRGRRWVTRQGIKIDRTACSWLIRRFIDPQAQFVFVNPDQYVHQEGEVRFDMFGGEFTHEGGRCSFETLVRHYHLESPGLRAIGEIVHDLDLKDAKFGRPENAGVSAMIDGICTRHGDDAERLQEGLIVFDALFAQLGKTSGA